MNHIQAAYVYVCLLIGSIIKDVINFIGGKNGKKKNKK